MDGHSLGGDVAGRRDNRAGLHLVDGRELEAEPAAAQTQHRVDLPQLLQVGQQRRLGGKGLGRTAGGPKFHHVLQNLDEAGQKLVERRVQQPDHRGPALQHPEYRLEICNLIAFQNGKTGVEIPVALSPSGLSAQSWAARIIDRTMSRRSGSKNMCSVRQRPMPSAPNSSAARTSRG